MDELRRPTNPRIRSILEQRGHVREPQNGEYQACVENQSKPEMGFFIETRSGEVHGFMYHNVDNLAFKPVAGRHAWEVLSFSHRGKAVTMRGQGLKRVFQSLMAHRVKSLHEFVGPAPADCDRHIDRVAIDHASGGDEHIEMH